MTRPRPRSPDTTVFSRIVTIQFSKAMDPATITLANVYVLQRRRRNVPSGTRCSHGSTSTTDPRAKLSYDPTHQHGDARLHRPAPDRDADRPLPDRRREPASRTGVTDLVGNQLDGDFTASSPPATDRPAALRPGPRPAVAAGPVVTSFQMTAATDTGIPGDQNTNAVPARIHRPGLQRLPGHGRQPAGLRPVQRAAPRAGRRLRPRRRRRRPRLRWALRRRRDDRRHRQVHVHRAARCRRASSGPRSWWSASPISPPCPASLVGPATAFRIDKTPPQITGASLTAGGNTSPARSTGQSDPISQLHAVAERGRYSNPQRRRLLATPCQSCSPRSTRRRPRISATTR